jgi:hypothetical protein
MLVELIDDVRELGDTVAELLGGFAGRATFANH